MSGLARIKGPEVDRQPSCLLSLINSKTGLKETEVPDSPVSSAAADAVVAQTYSFSIGKFYQNRAQVITQKNSSQHINVLCYK